MIRNSLFIILTALTVVGCTKVDDNRIPNYTVRINLDSPGLWTTYGVHGYGNSRRFIRENPKEPANFNYSVSSYTGFGGVLLISGFSDGDYNSVLAYDLACPVEAKTNARIDVDPVTFEAVCPHCGSHYNVCEGFGRPVSGPAVEYNYGLRRYRATGNQINGYIITN